MASKLDLTVVAVVHQPRFEIFTMFDDVLLLGKGGRTVYLGPSVDALPYFEVRLRNRAPHFPRSSHTLRLPPTQQSLGFTCPSRVNPADHFLDIIADDAAGAGRLPRVWTERQRAASLKAEQEAAAAAAATAAVVAAARNGGTPQVLASVATTVGGGVGAGAGAGAGAEEVAGGEERFSTVEAALDALEDEIESLASDDSDTAAAILTFDDSVVSSDATGASRHRDSQTTATSAARGSKPSKSSRGKTKVYTLPPLRTAWRHLVGHTVASFLTGPLGLLVSDCLAGDPANVLGRVATYRATVPAARNSLRDVLAHHGHGGAAARHSLGSTRTAHTAASGSTEASPLLVNAATPLGGGALLAVAQSLEQDAQEVRRRLSMPLAVRYGSLLGKVA